jgi:alpha-L-fucosidase 2
MNSQSVIRRFGLGAHAISALVFPLILHAAPPERGFISKAPATKWEQALVSGNGTHGAMVFGVPADETVIINHGLLYLPLHPPLPAPETATILPEIRNLMADGNFQKAADQVVELANKNGYSGKHWTDPFVPACDLKIAMPPRGELRDYERSVDFATGVASVSWSDDRGSFLRKLFVSRKDDVIAMSITGPGKGGVDCTLSLATRPFKGTGGWGPEKMFKNGVKDIGIKADKDLLVYQSAFTHAFEGGLQGYEVVSRVIPKSGTITTEEGSITIHGADEVLILLRVVLLRSAGKSQVTKTATDLAALPADFATLLEPHAAIHGEIFNRSRLDLGGGVDRSLPSEELISKSKAGATNRALLEKLYDASRYNILCSSGALMPNLQGIWTGTWSPFWSGDFTMNGNLQTAMAANLSANMAECLEPYWKFLETNMPAFRDNAKRLYGCRGIHVPSRASTHGFNNHFDGEWPMTFWTTGAPWAAQFMYDYYLYTDDQKFLRERALPFMKEAALFFEDFLIAGPDGKLLFSPSYSPENHPSNNPSQACVNATMDISAAKELLENLVATCEKLGVEKDGVTRWRAMLAKMPSYQINSDGALKEWTTPLLEDNYAHRHCSHLYAIYYGMPAEIKNDPELLQGFRVALEKRMDVRRKEAEDISVNGRPPGEMAFGIVFEAMAAASLRHADECALIVEWLANRYWNSNLVSTHNPKEIFNTDICGGLPAVIHRMLVDSQPGWIELLPALPAGWYEGRIEGIRCRGNIEIRSLDWSHENRPRHPPLRRRPDDPAGDPRRNHTTGQSPCPPVAMSPSPPTRPAGKMAAQKPRLDQQGQSPRSLRASDEGRLPPVLLALHQGECVLSQ